MTKQSIFRMALVYLILTVFLTLLIQPPSKVFADTDHCGAIVGNETWGVAGNVHTVSCDVTVTAGATLTINPGVIVKFDSDTSLFIDGKLMVNGASNNLVYFTSYRDDTIGGDTNGNGSSVGVVEDWGRIHFSSESDDTSIIENTEIRFSGNDGTSIFDDFGAIGLDNASPILRNIIFKNNFLNGAESLGGAWDTDTWDNTDIIYYVRSNLIIPTNNTLTLASGLQAVFFQDVTVVENGTLKLQPNVIVKFGQDDSLFINGKLEATGTSSNPIYFTSATDDTVGGDGNGDGSSVGAVEDWGRIHFSSESDDTSIIEYAEVRFSGNDGTSIFDDYGAIGLDNASPILRNITFKNNFLNGAESLGGAWNTDTWDNTDVIYYVRSDLIIPGGNTLTLKTGLQVQFWDDVTVTQNSTLKLEAGSILKFGSDDSLIIDGKLDAQGTFNNPIYFTSYRDDSIGGDGNGDGSSSGSVEDWGRIQFNASSDDNSIITWALIRYSGNDGTSIFDDFGAIRLSNASPTIRFSKLSDNYRGIEALSGSMPSLICNDILNSTSLGIFNDTPSIPVAAQGHWWGHPTGPAHATNPGGLGESVSDGVIYAPWAASSCFVEQPNFDNFVYLPMVIK